MKRGCVIFSFRKGQVHHWHWPRQDITRCPRAADHVTWRNDSSRRFWFRAGR